MPDGRSVYITCEAPEKLLNNSVGVKLREAESRLESGRTNVDGKPKNKNVHPASFGSKRAIDAVKVDGA